VADLGQPVVLTARVGSKEPAVGAAGGGLPVAAHRGEGKNQQGGSERERKRRAQAWAAAAQGGGGTSRSQGRAQGGCDFDRNLMFKTSIVTYWAWPASPSMNLEGGSQAPSRKQPKPN
jgi:hypothetical protein